MSLGIQHLGAMRDALDKCGGVCSGWRVLGANVALVHGNGPQEQVVRANASKREHHKHRCAKKHIFVFAHLPSASAQSAVYSVGESGVIAVCSRDSIKRTNVS
jgi:hypothetical protein